MSLAVSELVLAISSWFVVFKFGCRDTVWCWKVWQQQSQAGEPRSWSEGKHQSVAVTAALAAHCSMVDSGKLHYASPRYSNWTMLTPSMPWPNLPGGLGRWVQHEVKRRREGGGGERGGHSEGGSEQEWLSVQHACALYGLWSAF